MEFKEKDLIMVRLPNDLEYEGRQPHFNTWIRVLFIDNDGTFIGKCERIDKMNFTFYKIGEQVQLNTDKVLAVYDEDDGQQWCYSDNITRCSCPGLCRNK